MCLPAQMAQSKNFHPALPCHRPGPFPRQCIDNLQPAEGCLLCASSDLLEQRRLPGRDVERRPTAIHLYGVDLMSTAECLGYFAEWGPTFCEWINDSSCTLLMHCPILPAVP